MTDLNNVETYEILEVSRPEEMGELTRVYEVLEENLDISGYFADGILENYDSGNLAQENASDFLCDSEPLDIQDVELFMEDNNSSFSSNAELNKMFDSYMEEFFPNVTKDNDCEYSGSYYTDYKDMLYNDGTIHELQNDQYEY